MAVTAETSDLTHDTAGNDQCRKRKATITVSVTAVDARRATAKRQAVDRANELKEERKAEMKRTIHCPTGEHLCPSDFYCYEDPPWQYSRVRPELTITPDNEETPTQWTAVQTFLLKAWLRCECIRGTIPAKAQKIPAEEIEDELAELIKDMA